MSKVVKTILSPIRLVIGDKAADALIGVALVVAGVVTGNFALIGAGISIASGALKKGPPKASPADRSRLISTIDPRTPRKIVFGTTAMANDIRDQEFTGTGQEYLHRFIVVASHAVDEISQITFDDKLAWTLAGGVQGEFVGYLTVAPILEGNAGNAINISARMGTTRRYTGLAYVHLRFKLTGNSKKAESPFSSAVPSRITIEGNGIAVYDPRQDTTAGGSGAHRADDQSTWTWGTHARNPALQALTYLLGWKINGILAVGKGIPPRRFDLESFIDAANICDESVALDAGGTEPRYRTDGVFSEADDMGLVLGQFAASMDARFYDPQGRIAVKCMVNDLASPIASFTAADILGAVQWTPFADLGENYNLVRGTYTDPSPNSLYQSVDYPEQYVVSVDGIDRILTLDLPIVQSASQAQRLARRTLMRAKYGGGTLSCEMQATAWRCEQFAPIELTFGPLGMVDKVFRVEEIETRVDGTVPIVLAVEDERIYDWDAEDLPPVDAIATTPYVPGNSPIIQGIGQASIEIIAPPNQNINVDYAGDPLTGQFSRTLKPIVFQGGVDIRDDDNVSYSITPVGVTATVNNIAADPEKGWITVTAGGSGYIDLTVTIDGIAYGPYRIVFTRLDGVATASSPKFGTRSTFATISTTSYVEMFTPITVTVAGSETVTMTAPLEYNISDTVNASAGLDAKWQRSPAGAGTWTDLAAAVIGSDSTWLAIDFSGEPGSGSYPDTDSPAAADYDYRMVGRLDINFGTPDLNVFSGTATVIVT
ncbi:MAG: hypothetical protein V4657_09480 [Pseudomonadota bacterium]